MSGYVLKRDSDGDPKRDGAYVTNPGSSASYSRSLRQARIFTTREEAVGNACGNERAFPVDGELHG